MDLTPFVGPEVAVAIAPFDAAYVEIPKVACSSIKIALARLLDIELDGPGRDPHQSSFPLVRPDLDGSSMFPGYYSFAFVRSPWSRLLSCYKDKILLEAQEFTISTKRPGVADCFADFAQFRPKMPFPEFVEAVASIPDSHADAHFRSQYTFVTNTVGDIAVDRVGRFESLEEDLREIQLLTGMPPFVLPVFQRTGAGRQYERQYDAHTRSLVEKRFYEDISCFGYQF